MNRIGLGVIGCGAIARTAHLPAAARLKDQLQIVATADVNLAAAHAAASPWDAACFEDYRGLLEHEAVEAVLIATPEYLHCEQVVAAAKAGKHILCEKPIAATISDADEMIEASENARVILMVGHSRRFAKRYREVRAAIASGCIGDVILVRENERRGRDHMSLGGIRWTPKHWTGDPKFANGIALSHAIHEVDLFAWFTDAKPTSVIAEHAFNTPGNVGVPDFISFSIAYENGAIASSEISNSLPPLYPAFHELEVYGAEGWIGARDHQMIRLQRYRDAGALCPDTRNFFLYDENTYVRQLYEFIDSIREGRTAMDPRAARSALAVALALRDAARTGCRITVGRG